MAIIDQEGNKLTVTSVSPLPIRCSRNYAIIKIVGQATRNWYMEHICFLWDNCSSSYAYLLYA